MFLYVEHETLHSAIQNAKNRTGMSAIILQVFSLVSGNHK